MKATDHITDERVQEFARSSVGEDLGTSYILSSEESAHLRECASCAEILVETVRESVRQTLSDKNPL
jgi:hypothetical protein